MHEGRTAFVLAFGRAIPLKVEVDGRAESASARAEMNSLAWMDTLKVEVDDEAEKVNGRVDTAHQA